ncbi:MAG: AraC family transcriptional regulator [Candidatus Ornithomonoglobus sp.]
MRSFHYHQSYEILYIINGKKTYMSTEGFYELTPGTVALTPPNAIHKTSDKEICEKITFYFTQHYLSQNFSKQAQELLLRCFNKKTLKIGDDSIEDFTRLCTEASANSDNKSDFFVYAGKILKYLTEISFAHSEQKISRESKITAILKFIQNNSKSIRSIEEIADAFNITKFHLCRLFREELDTTAVQYLNVIRTQNMCNMLTDKKLSISECSENCGFHSSEYAARVFSGIMHMSPTEYRKAKRGG